jgi:NAD-dependent deacetylase
VVRKVSDGLETLTRLVAESRHAVVLTGAGVSTESGLPDFRSDSGLWRDAGAMELLSRSTLRMDPRRFYTQGLELLETLTRAEPNLAHRALAALEAAGRVQTVITQNIDNLHHRAGSRRVLEVHGHLRTASCERCGEGRPFAELVMRVRRGEIPPLCSRCRGWLRPDVVLFEDGMPPAFGEAVREVERSDLLLVVGSSLQVAPVAYLPRLASRLAIVNLGPTPYDAQAAVVINARAGEVLGRLAAALGADRPGGD